jgi:DNA-binding response OmpR family regulator
MKLSIIEQPELESETVNPIYIAQSEERQPILLLSDNQDLSRIIQISLETLADWQVFLADLDYQSLILIEIIKPAIILLDTVLPNLQQLGMLENIASYPALQNIPIVLLTERMRLADRQMYARLGIASAIAKPFDPMDLARQIETKLNKERGNSHW